MRTYFIISVILLGSIIANAQHGIEHLDHSLRSAYVKSTDEYLEVSTGKMTYRWDITTSGLVTSSIQNLNSNKEWINRQSAFSCDWFLKGLIEDTTSAKLVKLSAQNDTDEQFTTEHIQVVAEFHYSTNLAIQFEIWIYPGAPGIRTQINAKVLHGVNKNLFYYNKPDFTRGKPFLIKSEDRALYLPVNFKGINRKAFGYHSGTQQRNAANTPLLKEELVTGPPVQPEVYDWPSGLVLQDQTDGLVVIKESHKCVNQSGINTGSFFVDNFGLRASGWGLTLPDLKSEVYKESWANWIILFDGDDTEMQKSIKEFDRVRYPIDPQRDIYILANTWGSGNHRAAAREDNVLTELESQAYLGIDVQQVDDGWQNPVELHWTQTTQWRPHASMYPQGWRNIVSKAKKEDVTLGLWMGIGMHSEKNLEKYGDNSAKLPDLKWNYDHGGFKYYKCDFSLIRNYNDKEQLFQRIRAFIKYTDYSVRVNWDVTETEPRLGYYFGREYGNIYLENRKPKIRPDVLYVPYMVLRDAWHLSKYVNLNKFQITVQNIDRVDTVLSNAYLYNHPYSVAIALMSSPIFFQETHLYDEEARDEIRELLSIYKKERNEMYKGFVYPIGAEPNDKSWTGFQCHMEDSSGYLMIYRELNNNNTNKKLNIKFLEGKKLRVTNLRDGSTYKAQVGTDGLLEFSIRQPADFLYLKYELY